MAAQWLAGVRCLCNDSGGEGRTPELEVEVSSSIPIKGLSEGFFNVSLVFGLLCLGGGG